METKETPLIVVQTITKLEEFSKRFVELGENMRQAYVKEENGRSLGISKRPIFPLLAGSIAIVVRRSAKDQRATQQLFR